MLKGSFFIFIIIAIGFSSCSVNKDFMFKTDKDFVFNTPVIDSSSLEYRIGVNDVINFDLYTNNGSLMLQFTTSELERTAGIKNPGFDFTVDIEGYVEFPVIGRKYVVGYTIRELQNHLEELYSFQFNNPMALVRVVNRRCIVFNGSAGGKADVIPLTNVGMSVIEAIAMAGGIGPRGKASRVKLIRMVNGKQEVYLLDLSTIEGIKYANMSVEADDIIYVEPNPNIPREVLTDVQPVVGVLSSLALTYAIFARIF